MPVPHMNLTIFSGFTKKAPDKLTVRNGSWLLRQADVAAGEETSARDHGQTRTTSCLKCRSQENNTKYLQKYLDIVRPPLQDKHDFSTKQQYVSLSSSFQQGRPPCSSCIECHWYCVFIHC